MIKPADATPHKILVLRTSPFPLFYEQAKEILQQFPLSQSTVFTQAEFENDLKANTKFERIITYPGGMISVDSIPKSISERLKKEKFDVVVIALANPGGDGYENVFHFAREIRATSIWQINSTLHTEVVKEKSVKRKHRQQRLLNLAKKVLKGTLTKRQKIVPAPESLKETDVCVICLGEFPVVDGSINRITLKSTKGVKNHSVSLISLWDSRSTDIEAKYPFQHVYVKPNWIQRFFDKLRKKSPFLWKLFNPQRMVDDGRYLFVDHAIPALKKINPKVVVIHNRLEAIEQLREALPEARIAPFMNNDWLSLLPEDKKARVFNELDGFIAISAEVTERAKEAFPGSSIPYWVVHNGIDTDHFHPDKRDEQRTVEMRTLAGPPGSKVILFAARMVEEKGLHLLLKAFSLVQEKLPEARLLVSGSKIPWRTFTPFEVALERQIASKPELVTSLGFVTYDEMPNFMAAADVYVLPSIFKQEGLPSSLIEALSTGTPTVGSYAGGIPEVIKHGVNALHADPTNAEELAAAIIKAATDDAFRKQAAVEGRKTVLEGYSDETMGAAFAEAIDGLMAMGPRK